MKIRIWHQNFWDVVVLPTDCRPLEAHTRAMADEETEIVVHGLLSGLIVTPYPDGIEAW
ncbi:MAG: hypothetical protein WBH57_05980 [Anaerolineae bacterium]